MNTIHTPAGPAPEPAAATTAELLVTAPDAAALRRIALAAHAAAGGAALYMTTREPWQIRACQGELSDAAWRERLLALVEAVL
jgi:hypothetical protein